MKHLLFFALTAALILAGCNDNGPTNGQQGLLGGVVTAPCGYTTFSLTAGQTTNVGSVTVSNDNQNVYITYTLNYAGACFGNLHVWVGSSLSAVPGSKNGTKRPAPGQFCNAAGGRCFNATGQTTYTFTIPFSELGIDIGDYCDLATKPSYYVVTHAEVDMDCNPATPGHETAFGGSTAGPGNAWWFYGQYTFCCDFGSGGNCTDETGWGGASAGGGNAWWFYFDTHGPATQPIYAGQNLTDGSITWDGTNITINLGSELTLKNVAESVKAQGYDVIPASRPPAGQFTLYKGTSLTFAGSGSRFYAIHLDVVYCPAQP